MFLALGCVSKTTQLSNESPIEPYYASRGYIAVPLQKISTGLLLLESEINGVPGMLIVDSGASATLVDSSASKDLFLKNMETSWIQAFAIGETGPTKSTVLESLVIGPLTFQDRRTLLMDFGHMTNILSLISGQQIYGVLGQDILESHSAIIDIRNRLLYLKPDDF